MIAVFKLGSADWPLLIWGDHGASGSGRVRLRACQLAAMSPRCLGAGGLEAFRRLALAASSLVGLHTRARCANCEELLRMPVPPRLSKLRCVHTE